MEFLLLLKLVEIGMVSFILLSVNFSKGFTSQRNGIEDMCGFGIHQGFGTPPTMGLTVKGSFPLHSFPLVEI